MTDDVSEDDSVRRLALEIGSAPTLHLALVPMDAFHLAELVQLAERHPELPEDLRRAARRYVAHTRQHFVDGACPAVVEELDRGDEPVEDDGALSRDALEVARAFDQARPTGQTALLEMARVLTGWRR